MKVNVTLNNDEESEVEYDGEISSIVMRALEHQLKLPSDWTSLVLVIVNQEPTP